MQRTQVCAKWHPQSDLSDMLCEVNAWGCYSQPECTVGQGKHLVCYDDGQEELLDTQRNVYRVLSPQPSRHLARHPARCVSLAACLVPRSHEHVRARLSPLLLELELPTR